MKTPIFPSIDRRDRIIMNDFKQKEFHLSLKTRLRIKSNKDGKYYYIVAQTEQKLNMFHVDQQVQPVIFPQFICEVYELFISNCYNLLHLSSEDSFLQAELCKFPDLPEEQRVRIKATLNMPGNIYEIL